MKKSTVLGVLLVAVPLMLVAAAAGAEELTVDFILDVQRSGAPADVIVNMIDSPDNTLAMTAGDIATLYNAGVPKSVITAIWAHIPAYPATVPRPDDARLIDLVQLIEARVSESIIAEQVRQSGRTYNLSVNDLLYLKENGAGDSTIAALMETHAGEPPAAPAVAPSKVVFDDLELVNTGFWRRDRKGRLVMRGDVLEWEGRRSKDNFEIRIPGLEKIWYTCEARPSESFCYQLNLEIVKGDRFRFRDVNRDSGSNVAVTTVMEALRTYFPRLPFGPPAS